MFSILCSFFNYFLRLPMFSVKSLLICLASTVFYSASSHLFSLHCSLISLNYFVQPPSLSFNFFLQPPMFSVQLQHLCSASAVMSNDTFSVRDPMFCPASTVLFQPQPPVVQLFSVSTPLLSLPVQLQPICLYPLSRLLRVSNLNQIRVVAGICINM
jgi:hypothetical protein